MAQSKLFQHKDEIKSWEANFRSLGPVSPGRIRGYDYFTEGASDASNCKINIGHQGHEAHLEEGTSGFSGLDYSDTSNVEQEDNGVAIMKDGTMIIEDAAIGPFDIPINIAAGERQRSWIVAEHTWTAVSGGSSATYSVISGAVSTGSTYNNPVLTNPEKQVVIAEFDVPKTSEYARTFANIIAISRGAIQQYSNGRNAAQMRAELDLYTTGEVDAAIDADIAAQVAALIPYTRWEVVTSQVGTNAPTIAITHYSDLTLSSIIRNGVGDYEVYFSGTPINLSQGKTIAFIANGGNPGYVTVDVAANNQIIILTYDMSGTPSDDILSNTGIFLRVYP